MDLGLSLLSLTRSRKIIFQLKISSVNLTKFGVSWGFTNIYWRNLSWNFIFCAVWRSYVIPSVRRYTSQFKRVWFLEGVYVSKHVWFFAWKDLELTFFFEKSSFWSFWAKRIQKWTLEIGFSSFMKNLQLMNFLVFLPKVTVTLKAQCRVVAPLCSGYP